MLKVILIVSDSSVAHCLARNSMLGQPRDLQALKTTKQNKQVINTLNLSDPKTNTGTMCKYNKGEDIFLCL